MKHEEKIEKMPMKRQRRQKTTSDSIAKEEERKVGEKTIKIDMCTCFSSSAQVTFSDKKKSPTTSVVCLRCKPFAISSPSP